MKVIKSPPNKWASAVTCSVCEAELEIEVDDLKRVCGFDQRDNSEWDYVNFTCPICNRATRCSQQVFKSIPAHLLAKVSTR